MFPRLPTFLLLSKLSKNFCKTDHRASLFNFIPHSHETLSTRGSLDSPVWLCVLSVIPEVRPTPKPGVPLNTAGHRRADPVQPSIQNCLKTHSALSHPASPFSSHPCPSHFPYSS